MPTGVRIDPYRSFRFRVEIEGIQTAAFSEASIPTTETKSIEYREGTDPTTTRKLSTLDSYTNLTLKKGLTDSLDLYEWRKLAQDFGAGAARRNISLVLIDDEGNDKARWEIVEAWPTKMDTSGFNATGGETMVQTLEIVNEGITRVS